MLKVDMSVDWGGRPLSELQRLLEKRIQQLKETPRNACIATAITVLKSIRPLVLKAKTSPRPGAHYTIVDTGWVGGWTSKGDKGKMSRFFRGTGHGLRLDSTKYMRRCVKTAARNGREVINVRPIWLTGAGAFDKGTVHVFRVTPRHSNVMLWKMNRHKGCWYIAAYDQKTAENHVARLMRTYLKKFSGMARYAMTRAMTDLHASGTAGDRVSEAAKKVAGDNVIVVSRGGDWGWHVRVNDSLAYAAKAFKRSDAVEYAMAKAANSIAGMLRARSKGLFDPSLETPFPEIAGHRRKGV